MVYTKTTHYMNYENNVNATCNENRHTCSIYNKYNENNYDNDQYDETNDNYNNNNDNNNNDDHLNNDNQQTIKMSLRPFCCFCMKVKDSEKKPYVERLPSHTRQNLQSSFRHRARVTNQIHRI